MTESLTEYIFTFSYLQRHPVTNEPLDDKFVRIKGRNFKDARRRMAEMFGYRYKDQFENEWQAGVKENRLVEIAPLERKDWDNGRDSGAGLDSINWVRGIGW